MTTNFYITDNYALTFGDRHIDLHNNFTFTGYEFRATDRELSLFWTKSTGAWIGDNEFSTVTLIHKGVAFANIKYETKNNDTEHDCLDIVSFYPADDRETNDSFVSNAKPKEGDDVLYIFTTDDFIRIACNDIVLITK